MGAAALAVEPVLSGTQFRTSSRTAMHFLPRKHAPDITSFAWSLDLHASSAATSAWHGLYTDHVCRWRQARRRAARPRPAVSVDRQEACGPGRAPQPALRCLPVNWQISSSFRRLRAVQTQLATHLLRCQRAPPTAACHLVYRSCPPMKAPLSYHHQVQRYLPRAHRPPPRTAETSPACQQLLLRPTAQERAQSCTAPLNSPGDSCHLMCQQYHPSSSTAAAGCSLTAAGAGGQAMSGRQTLPPPRWASGLQRPCPSPSPPPRTWPPGLLWRPWHTGTPASASLAGMLPQLSRLQHDPHHCYPGQVSCSTSLVMASAAANSSCSWV